MTRKKLLMLLGSVCLVLTMLLMACAAPSPSPAPTPAPTPTPSPSPSPTPAPTPAEEVWELKMQSNWTGIGNRAYDMATELYVDHVSAMSGGRITVINYDAEVLLGIGETFTGVADGVADLAVTSPIYHRGIVPVGMYLWAVPFTIDRMEFAEMIYQQLGGKEIWREAYAEHGVMGLDYQLSDEWGGTISTVPIAKYSDYKGLKVRAFGIWADWLVHNGASITVVPGGEIYMAIQTGILDAAMFGAPNAWAGMMVAEVCDYYIDPPIINYDICEMMMNLEKFNEMPADLQEIMLAASRVFALDFASLLPIEDVKGRQDLAAGGMEFMRMEDSELLEAKAFCMEKFQESAEIDDYCARWVDVMNEAMELHEAYFGPKRLP